MTGPLNDPPRCKRMVRRFDGFMQVLEMWDERCPRPAVRDGLCAGHAEARDRHRAWEAECLRKKAVKAAEREARLWFGAPLMLPGFDWKPLTAEQYIAKVGAS